MCRHFLNGAIRTSVVVLAVVQAASATPGIIFQDDFDSYADQAAFEGVWSRDGNPVLFLDTSFGHPGQSVQVPNDMSGGGVTNRWFHDFGATYNGTDAEPLVFSYDLYLPPEGEADLWTDTVSLADLRGYPGGAYKQGILEDLLGMGVVPLAWSFFQGRIIRGTIPDGAYSGGYWDLAYSGPNSSPPRRSSGWHELQVVVKSSQVTFTVDKIRALTFGVAPRAFFPLGFNSVMLGAGTGSAGGLTTWIDNVRVEILPEPTTLTLAVMASWLLVHRRRPAVLSNPIS